MKAPEALHYDIHRHRQQQPHRHYKRKDKTNLSELVVEPLEREPTDRMDVIMERELATRTTPSLDREPVGRMITSLDRELPARAVTVVIHEVSSNKMPR